MLVWRENENAGLASWPGVDQPRGSVSLSCLAIINTYEAKAKLSDLVRRARNGEEIVIAQAGVPMVRLVPVRSEVNRSRLGLDLAAFAVPSTFDDPLLDEY